MNCVHCDYLLWDLPECRCPECGAGFEVTDYSFSKQSVHFICSHCGQSYLGTDERGLPRPSRFECVTCHQIIDAAHMAVRPIEDSARGEPLRFGTPWQDRSRVGLVPGFVDAVARLAIDPDEYFRRASANRNDGAMFFSVLCAYVSTAVFLGVMVLFHRAGLAGWVPDVSVLFRWHWVLALIIAVPAIHFAWTYLYGLLIQAVLWGLGGARCEFESSVRAVALGSAVLPAVLLFPPIGLVWYLVVVCSGLEHFHETTKAKALTAATIPMLIAGNAGLFLFLSYWVA